MKHTKKHRFNKHQRPNAPSAETMASKADINVLYGKSVQCAEAEIDFVDETFTNIRGRKAVILREDFCGTTNVSCEWVRRHQANKAIAVDLDAQLLAWVSKENISKLTEQQASRITLINSDVMTVDTGTVDTILAMNFSYWCFKERTAMMQYFEAVYNSLADDGILFLDAFGGYEAYKELKETTKHGKFTYIWEQADYNPITGHMQCYIHFKFKDGSRINKAFVYEWRLWTLPEITEMLHESGFKPMVHWEGTDPETGEGDGCFKATTKGSADPGWVAYITAEKIV